MIRPDLNALTLAIGSAAALYLETTVGSDETIGISSWSETLLRMVASMQPRTRAGACRVVQILGGVGNPLAEGLFHAVSHAREEGDLERQDALLEELRALQASHPEDPAVREYLALGLLITFIDAKRKGDAERARTLSAEVSDLVSRYPHDPTSEDIVRALEMWSKRGPS